MSTETKILKHFNAGITSCKDYHREYRKICIICRDGKYGLAEMDKTGYPRILEILIECKYDHIDSFCGLCGESNMVCVYLNGKCGLYVFRYTISSKSNRIDCKQVAECDYTFIEKSRNIIMLYKNDQERYFNSITMQLSPFYFSLFQMQSYLRCYTEKTIKWVHIWNDNVIYECPDDGHIVNSREIRRNLYLFTHNYEGQRKRNLVFYNDKLMTSFMIEDVNNLKVTDFVNQHDCVVSFSKDDKNHNIAANGFQWNFDEIRKIAKEVDYT